MVWSTSICQEYFFLVAGYPFFIGYFAFEKAVHPCLYNNILGNVTLAEHVFNIFISQLQFLAVKLQFAEEISFLW